MSTEQGTPWTDSIPAIKRIKAQHKTNFQVLDFGRVLGNTGPSFFHPEVSHARGDDNPYLSRGMDCRT